jgi:hypothetical protein
MPGTISGDWPGGIAGSSIGEGVRSGFSAGGGMSGRFGSGILGGLVGLVIVASFTIFEA